MTLQIDPTELRQIYESWDSEEILARLNTGDLEPEAQLIARQVLSDRGLEHAPSHGANLSAISRAPSEKDLSRRLWNGGFVRICQFSFILPAWLPVQHALDRSGVLLGALWVSLLALTLAYAGYRIGRVVTQSICANEMITYIQKKRALWFLLAGVIGLYFVLFVLADVLA